MGVIDETSYQFHCARCDIEEKVRVRDRGSMWGGPHWQSGPKLDLFEIVWEGGGKTEPEVVSILCKKCGMKPEIALCS